MAWVRWALVALMTAIAALSVAYSFGLLGASSASAAATLYHCPMHPQVVQDHPGECPICGMTLVPTKDDSKSAPQAPKAKPAAKAPAPSGSHQGHRHDPRDPYACPMHPEETGTSSEDRCPLCGMKLQKRASSDGSTSDTAPTPPVPGLAPVTLTLERTQLIGMRTALVESQPLPRQLRAVGFVTADEARLARVPTRFAGWVQHLAVSTTGEKVRRGQPMASIFNLELLPAQQEFLTARRWNESNAAAAGGAAPLQIGGMERDARTRLELFGMSSTEIDAIAKSGKPARTVAISAPISGYVVKKSVVQGSYVQPGAELFELADLSEVWVLADVYEQDIARVSLGQEANIGVSAYPGQRFSGKVGLIAPTLDSASRTLRLRIELKNPEQKLKPGMYADVTLEAAESEALVIPREALVDTGEHQYVFLARPGGHFEPRLVRVGARSGDKVQILEGLAAGDQVVTTGNFLIDSESRLRAALQRAPRDH